MMPAEQASVSNKCHSVCNQHQELHKQKEYVSKFFNAAEKWGAEKPKKEPTKVYPIGFDKLKQDFKQDFDFLQSQAPTFASKMQFRSSMNSTARGDDIDLDPIDLPNFPEWVGGYLNGSDSDQTMSNNVEVDGTSMTSSTSQAQPWDEHWFESEKPSFRRHSSFYGPSINDPRWLNTAGLRNLGEYYWPYYSNLQQNIESGLASLKDVATGCDCIAYKSPKPVKTMAKVVKTCC
eukprot:CAMPEP_0197524798 /NCGR_PEP_ID=MMETSP1318-20131121/9925_1 /TAXON_ID=552666 /ORGANISM="Partenskyella glossopodia, Strain RCC365" /LENGTH=233 /DNA_ID=CAMNT_0043077847 /DNA_START=77 /DNA_END=778 /DNA_ORIENTATION=-